MTNIKNIAGKKELRTKFSCPLEIENYIHILGGKTIGKDKFMLDGLKFEVDREYQCVAIVSETKFSIEELFRKYGIEDSIYGSCILNLEGLLLLHMKLCGANIERDFNLYLNQAKRVMLESVLGEKQKIEFTGIVKYFDEAVAPFLDDDFNSEKFLKQCVFNTTGYYKKEGYDKCLRFGWKTKKDPDILYLIEINKYGYQTTIMHKKPYDQGHKQLYHFCYANEQIQYYEGSDYSYIYETKDNTDGTKSGTVTEHHESYQLPERRTIDNSDLERILALEKILAYEKFFIRNAPLFRRNTQGQNTRGTIR